MDPKIEACDPQRLSQLLDTEAVSPPMPLSERPGTRIGRYKLLQLIGEGGFGSVFMAEQETPVVRKVALKIIKLGMDTKQVIARFEAERQALAMMDHPNISRVLDAGATDTGRPYFVMELVKGIPITEFCNQSHLPARKRLELFIQVCRAIQHAHQKGVIHRDLKPGNVLVTLHDGVPVPKVIDFGIAKATSQRLTEHTLFTEFRLFIGTPQYMPPEQADISGLDVDTRADIYSLGVLLYELLTDTTPFDPRQLRESAYTEVQRIIREVEPPKPSTRLSTMGTGLQALAARMGTDPRKLNQLIAGELDWIVMKCLEKDRSRRYETANGLAQDVQRYLDDEPVEASPPSATYKLRKLVRRYRRQAIALAAVTIALMLGIIGTAIGLAQARHNLAIAREAEQKENAQRQLSERSALAEQEARKAAELNLASALISQGDALGAIQNWPQAKARYRQARELLKSQGRSAFPAEIALWDAARRSPGPLLEINAHPGGVNHLRFLPNGEQFATAGSDGTGRIWDTRTGRLIRTFPDLGDVQRLGISSDGELIAFASMDKGVTLWRISDGKPLRAIQGYTGRASAVSFSPKAHQLLVGTADAPYALYMFDFESGNLIQTLSGHQASIRDIAFTPDGLKAVSCDGRAPGDKLGFKLDASLAVWDLSTGAALWNRPADRNGRLAGAVAVSPDGGTVVCTCWDGAAKLCDVATGTHQVLVTSQRGRDVQGVAFSSNGFLAVGGPEGSIRVLQPVANDASSAFGSWRGNLPLAECRRFGGHVGESRTLDFSPDGMILASGGGDGMVRLWPVGNGGEARTFREAPDWNVNEIFTVALSSDGRLALSSSDQDRLVRLWDVASGNQINAIGTLNGHEPAATFGPGDKTIVLIEKDGGIGVWDDHLSRRLSGLSAPERRRFDSIALSPDGKTLLAWIANENDIAVYDLPAQRLIRHLSSGDDPSADRSHLNGSDSELWGDRRLHFAPDGSFAVGIDKYANILKVWDAADWHERQAIAVPHPTRVAVSHQGKWIACVGADVRVFDARSGRLAHHFEPAADQLFAVCFLADDRYLVTEGAAEDGLVLWDLDRDARVRSIGQGNFIFDLAFADEMLVWSQRQSSAGVVGALNLAHLDWIRTDDALAARLASVRPQLQSDPNDAEALAVFGQWYAFRGMDEWAVSLLERAAERAPLDAAQARLLTICRSRSPARANSAQRQTSDTIAK